MIDQRDAAETELLTLGQKQVQTCDGSDGLFVVRGRRLQEPAAQSTRQLVRGLFEMDDRMTNARQQSG